MNVIGCGVSNFIVFSRIEVLRGDGSVKCSKFSLHFSGVISGFEMMVLVCSLL